MKAGAHGIVNGDVFRLLCFFSVGLDAMVGRGRVQDLTELIESQAFATSSGTSGQGPLLQSLGTLSCTPHGTVVEMDLNSVWVGHLPLGEPSVDTDGHCQVQSLSVGPLDLRCLAEMFHAVNF